MEHGDQDLSHLIWILKGREEANDMKFTFHCFGASSKMPLISLFYGCLLLKEAASPLLVLDTNLGGFKEAV